MPLASYINTKSLFQIWKVCRKNMVNPTLINSRLTQIFSLRALQKMECKNYHPF